MTAIIEAAVLGMYVPIVLFAGVACWLLMSRLIWPALQEHTLEVDKYAIALSAAFALAAHAGENAYYGAARWLEKYEWMNSALLFVGTWKLFILASAIMAVAALSRATTDGAHLLRLALLAGAVWAVASVAAWLIV